jgi:hypothetical protein
MGAGGDGAAGASGGGGPLSPPPPPLSVPPGLLSTRFGGRCPSFEDGRTESRLSRIGTSLRCSRGFLPGRVPTTVDDDEDSSTGAGRGTRILLGTVFFATSSLRPLNHSAFSGFLTRRLFPCADADRSPLASAATGCVDGPRNRRSGRRSTGGCVPRGGNDSTGDGDDDGRESIESRVPSPSPTLALLLFLVPAASVRCLFGWFMASNVRFSPRLSH